MRSSSVDPVRRCARPTEPALRPRRIPAGMTNVPSGASRSSTRSQDHRPALVGIRDRPERARAAGRGRARTGRHRAGAGRRPGRARRSGPARRPTPRRSRRRGRPPAGRPTPGSTRRAGRGRRARRPSGGVRARRRSRPPTGAMRSSRSRSRRRCRSAPQVDHSADPVDDRIVGVRRARGPPSATTARSSIGGHAADARERPAPGSRRRSPISTTSTRRSRTSASGDGARPERAAGVVGRRAPARGAGRPAGRPDRRAGRPARGRPRRPRSPPSPKAPRCSAIPPARITVSSGRRAAAAATTAASSPSARRSSAAGGSPAPTRTRRPSASRSIADMASGSVVSALAGHGPPAAAGGRRDERGERPLRGGEDGQPSAAAWLADLEPRQVGGARPTSQVERRAASAADRPRSRGRRAPAMTASTSRAGRHRQRSEQTPAAADPTDERGGDGRGAQVEGEEGSGLARHRFMLPGRRAAAVGSVATGAGGRRARGQASQAISSSISSRRSMSSSIPTSSARISLRRREVAAEDAAQDRIEEEHRVGAERRDTAGWPRGSGRPARSGRAAGSRGRPARRARRAARRSASYGVLIAASAADRLGRRGGAPRAEGLVGGRARAGRR